MPHVEEQGVVGEVRGGFDVRVGEDDVGALAAQLQRDAFEVGCGGGFHDLLADFGAAGERDLVDVHVRGDGSTGGRAVTGDDVDDAIRESGVHGKLSNSKRRQRRLFRRFEHDGATGSQRRAPLPGLHQRGEVPRDDLAHDADRLMTGIGVEGPVDRKDLAMNLVRPAGIIAVDGCGKRDVGRKRISKRLAIVQRLQGGQLFSVGFDQLRQLV